MGKSGGSSLTNPLGSLTKKGNGDPNSLNQMGTDAWNDVINSTTRDPGSVLNYGINATKREANYLQNGGAAVRGSVAGGVVGGVLTLGNPAGVAAGSAVGGGLGSMLDQSFAKKKAAAAAEAAGNKEEAAQLRQQALAIEAAGMNDQELSALENSLRLNDKDLTRREQLIQSSDPAIIEAGQQALKLLKGEEASTLAPIRAQRDKEKAQLVNQLRSRLGSGAEESAAGQRALAEFDAATNAQMTGAQDAALGRLLGVSQNTSQQYGTNTNTALNSTIAGQYGNMSARRLSAITGNPVGANLGAEQSAMLGLAFQNQQNQTAMGLGQLGINAYSAYQGSRQNPPATTSGNGPAFKDPSADASYYGAPSATGKYK